MIRASSFNVNTITNHITNNHRVLPVEWSRAIDAMLFNLLSNGTVVLADDRSDGSLGRAVIKALLDGQTILQSQMTILG